MPQAQAMLPIEILLVEDNPGDVRLATWWPASCHSVQKHLGAPAWRWYSDDGARSSRPYHAASRAWGCCYERGWCRDCRTAAHNQPN
jgi:hypothetical protein